jgi:hypothetical protein
VITYDLNGTPSHGVKIKTQLPFTNGSQMPTIIIEGFNYGQSKPIGLILTWYIYGGVFYYPKISSFGDYTPVVKLANENGYVVIFIDDKQYYNRFSLRAFANGMSEQSSWFSNWSISDEGLTGTNIITVPYGNTFSGNINLPNGIWKENGSVGINSTSPQGNLHIGKQEAQAGTSGESIRLVLQPYSNDGGSWQFKCRDLASNAYLDINYGVSKALTIHNGGNIGIGTSDPGKYKLNVSGSIRADEIVVNTTGADFVFDSTYNLRSLPELETFIKQNKHLPEIAPAKEMQENGVSAGEMQAKLLQKVEELTLYVIEKDKEIAKQQQKLETQEQENKELRKLLVDIQNDVELIKKR